MARSRVAAGRGKGYDDIHKIAQGRVWTGSDAKARGLVDALGGLDAAIAEAQKLGKVDASKEVEFYPPDPNLIDFLGSFGAVSMPLGLSTMVKAIAAEIGPAEARVVNNVLRQLLALRKSPVQATMLFPVLFH